MNLILVRKEFRPDCTIGAMGDGEFFCHTLERPYDPDKAIVKGARFAIPEGRYRIKFTTSTKFARRKWYIDNGRRIPELQNVAGRENILIHVLNFPRETDGCIGVGDVLGDGEIHNSIAAYSRLVAALWQDEQNGIENWIEVKR